MNRRIGTTLLILLVILPLPFRLAHAEKWELLTHATLTDVKQLPVTAEQRLWLQHKQTLTMGILSYDTPPFSLRTLTNGYEGLNADYIGLVAELLGLNVRLVQYGSSEQRWRALTNGEIDVIPNVTVSQFSQKFVLSLPYYEENPILAVKTSDREALSADLSGVKVAMVKGYVALSTVTQQYPQAQIQVYDNYQEALSAVAYGSARVFLGSRYPVDRNYLNNLRIVRFASLPKRQVSFALRQSSSPLEALLNQALAGISPEKKTEIMQIWQSDIANGINQPLDLTPSEQRWISVHPEINVLLYGKDNTAPAAFIDDSGMIRGIAADVLALMALKTGVKFRFRSVESLQDLTRLLSSHEADMVAALAPSPGRSQEMLFSDPFVRTAFALVTAEDNNIVKRLSDLRGKKLALVGQAALSSEIATRYPEIRQVLFDTDEDMFKAVARGDVDAAVVLLLTANYQVNNRFRNKIKVVNTLGDITAHIAFAVSKNSPELCNILNKVLRALSPGEMELLAQRWRPNNMVIVNNFWGENRTFIILSAAVLLLVFSLAMVRTFWLRRKVLNASNQIKTLQHLLNAMPFPLTLRDLEGRLTYCNKDYLKLVNARFEEVKDKKITDQPRNISYEQAAYFQRIADEIAITGKAHIEDLEITLFDAEGNPERVLTANIWMLPWTNSTGRIVGIVAGSWDVSERNFLLKQLSEASERAEASNRAKSTFLSTMSHEIRTPMNAIIGMLDMAIKRGRMGEHDLQALEVAQQSAEGLVGLIGDILDLSRIEGAHVEFRPVKINLSELIHQLLVIFNGLAIDKNIYLKKILPSENTPDVVGDPLRIKQVLSNLLGNAIKFTDFGGVTLKLHQDTDLKSDQIRYVVEVIDTGVGIDEAQQDALFQPFAQADNHRAGTGLGLYISRNLCESMSGSLTLKSEMGKGTCVRAEFNLPIAQMEEEPESAIEKYTGKGLPLKVLVVDDNAANRMLLAKQLAWLGHHAHVAAGGAEGIELWQQNTFDVIVTDCNMPEMNGYEFTKRIRELEVQTGQPRVYILGFTANAMHEIVERCLIAGMNGCLFKPCSINNLAEALNRVEGNFSSTLN
ncbi:transporter substrate-binding domain-containing protein [Pantoea sp. JK]|uniref:transporter substrate-binding domain-containing protein n=1 Tax=Pantoea sp. JK TaxID=2871703 RepID=UPI00223877BF|nr:transporter substrate-binding domain-containing protein [Pantoea sp. JK]MCW6034641.1 transporter substrate-binding domain-containing protein [Pantoea sp. JK]